MKKVISSLCFIFTGCSGLFFYPDPHRYTTPASIGVEFVEFDLKEGNRPTLIGWELAAEGVERGTILFLHGNAGNISTHLNAIGWLSKAGFRVLAIDYAGYGGSAGVVDIEQIHDDVRRMIRYLIKREPDRKKRILFAQSLGAAVGLRVSSESEFADAFKLIIADSAFSSYRIVAREKVAYYWLTALLKWPLSYLVRDDFSPLRTLSPASTVPILFIHSENDQTVAAHHSRDLCEIVESRCTLWRIRDAPHIGYLHSLGGRARLLTWIESFPN